MQDEDLMHRQCNAKVLSGRLCQAVCQLTNREGGKVLGPMDACAKMGRPVLEVPHEKHPDLGGWELGIEVGAFEDCPNIPNPVPLVVTKEVVESVACTLSGTVGPSRVDAVNFCNVLL